MSLQVTSTRKMNAFSNETCLNVKHQPFIFQHCPNSFEHFDTCRSDCMRDATAAIAGSVVETTHRPRLFSSTTLSHPQANFLHQTCIANMYCMNTCHHILDAYQGEWYLGNIFFAQRKLITERCSLWDAFSGSIAIFIVDK